MTSFEAFFWAIGVMTVAGIVQPYIARWLP